jgi:hypothetical protein
MAMEISAAHKIRFDEIRKKLSLLGSKESTFVAVELLFYELLTIARSYGNESSENQLLEQLKVLEGNEYKKTQLKYQKGSHREKAIRQFVNLLKHLLADWTKKPELHQ